MKIKLSEVFDSKTQLPWEPGSYKTDAEDNDATLEYYQYWNGIYWGRVGNNAEHAYGLKNHISHYQNVRWQGLKHAPK